METTGYVEKAAEALHLSEKLRQLIPTISYDPGDQEWYSAYHEYEESIIRPEVFNWSLRLVGWLQYNYPQGPAFLEASCC